MNTNEADQEIVSIKNRQRFDSKAWWFTLIYFRKIHDFLFRKIPWEIYGKIIWSDKGMIGISV